MHAIKLAGDDKGQSKLQAIMARPEDETWALLAKRAEDKIMSNKQIIQVYTNDLDAVFGKIEHPEKAASNKRQKTE